jgi:hypothetical protein
MRLSKSLITGIAAATMLAAGTAEAKKAPPPLTPMELQALQSKEFETSKDNLFNAVMTVVQDLGYQVQSADLQTGFITAASAAEQKTNIWEALGGASSSAITKMTAFVQNMPNKMARVRLNFLVSKTTSSAYGQNSQNDKPILDATVYRNAWDKIDEALFVSGALEAPKPPEQAKSDPKAAPENTGPANQQAPAPSADGK